MSLTISSEDDTSKISQSTRPNLDVRQSFARKAKELVPKLYRWTTPAQSAIRFEKAPSQFFGLQRLHVHTIEELRAHSYGKGDEVLLDFEAHHVGYFSVGLALQGQHVDAPVRLRLTFGEVPYDVTESLQPSDATISTSWLPDEVINIDSLPFTLDVSRRHSFRYVRIEILDTSPRYRVRFIDPEVRAESSASPHHLSNGGPEAFCHDAELGKIDSISRYTLRECMQRVFEDGPRRDRRLWLGDLRLQALTNYCTFKNLDLVKRCLYMFAAVPRDDQSLPACVFDKPSLSPGSDYIVDYSALFGPAVYDYVVASDDVDFGREMWPTVLGSIQQPLQHLDVNSRFDGDLSPAWKFLDWSDGLDTDAGMHGLILYSLKQINELALLLDEPEPFSEVVRKMTQATQSFYEPALSVFVSGPQKQVSWVTQAWMALSGSMDRSILLQAILNAMASPHALKPLTPYAYHHVAEALACCGGEEHCLKLIKGYWGGMMRAGADTFWECFDKDDPRRSPYGDCHVNSYCHAWSCTPSYLLRVVLRDYLDSSQL